MAGEAPGTDVARPGAVHAAGQQAAFLRNHAKDIWACDFLQTFDLFFRSVFVFLIIEQSRASFSLDTLNAGAKLLRPYFSITETPCKRSVLARRPVGWRSPGSPGKRQGPAGMLPIMAEIGGKKGRQFGFADPPILAVTCSVLGISIGEPSRRLPMTRCEYARGPTSGRRGPIMHSEACGRVRTGTYPKY